MGSDATAMGAIALFGNWTARVSASVAQVSDRLIPALLLFAIGSASCGGAMSLAGLKARLRENPPCASKEACERLVGSAFTHLRECEEDHSNRTSGSPSCNEERDLVRAARMAAYNEVRPRLLQACQNAPSDGACMALRDQARGSGDDATEEFVCVIVCRENPSSLCCNSLRRTKPAEQVGRHADAPPAPPMMGIDPPANSEFSASSKPAPTEPDATAPRPTLQAVISLLPLEANAIDLVKIQQFVNAYAQFDDRPGGAARKAASDANAIIGTLQHDLMNNAYRVVNLTQNAQFTSQMLKRGFGSMMDFCDNLRTLIGVASAMVGDLSTTYGQVLTSENRALIRQQTDSFTRDNMASVGRWQRATEKLLDPRRR